MNLICKCYDVTGNHHIVLHSGSVNMSAHAQCELIPQKVTVPFIHTHNNNSISHRQQTWSCIVSGGTASNKSYRLACRNKECSGEQVHMSAKQVRWAVYRQTTCRACSVLHATEASSSTCSIALPSVMTWHEFVLLDFWAEITQRREPCMLFSRQEAGACIQRVGTAYLYSRPAVRAFQQLQLGTCAPESA